MTRPAVLVHRLVNHLGRRLPRSVPGLDVDPDQKRVDVVGSFVLKSSGEPARGRVSKKEKDASAKIERGWFERVQGGTHLNEWAGTTRSSSEDGGEHWREEKAVSLGQQERLTER